VQCSSVEPSAAQCTEYPCRNLGLNFCHTSLSPPSSSPVHKLLLTLPTPFIPPSLLLLLPLHPSSLPFSLRERWSLVQEEKELLADLEKSSGDKALEKENEKKDQRLGEIYEQLQNINAASSESKARKILFGLGFNKEMQIRPTKYFSGEGVTPATPTLHTAHHTGLHDLSPRTRFEVLRLNPSLPSLITSLSPPPSLSHSPSLSLSL
jgi:hypothetical protein